MKFTYSIVAGVVMASLLAGCAHMHGVNGPQEKSEIPAGIQVGIGGQEIKLGDRLNVLVRSCATVSRGVGKSRELVNECQNKKIGEATVLKVLDHDSAIVKPEGDLKMDKTMSVERQ